MGIDHGRADVPVSQQLLDRSYIVSVLQQMSRKRMPKRVATHGAEALGFRNLGSAVDYMRSPFAGVGATVANVKSNPDQVKRMLRGTLKSLEFTVNPANREKVVGLIMVEFKLNRQDADRALTESVKAFSRDGIIPDDAVKAEIEDLRQRLKLRGEISTSQLVDYTLLKEVLAEMKR